MDFLESFAMIATMRNSSRLVASGEVSALVAEPGVWQKALSYLWMTSSRAISYVSGC